MELALDFIIIILLGVMIGYMAILNFKLKAFRGAQDELAAAAGKLDHAIQLAQNSVEALKRAAVSEEVRLKGLIEKSQLLADELQIITESGSNLADRIEQGLVHRPTHSSDDKVAFRQEHDEPQTDLISSDIEDDSGDSEMLETLRKIR